MPTLRERIAAWLEAERRRRILPRGFVEQTGARGRTGSSVQPPQPPHTWGTPAPLPPIDDGAPVDPTGTWEMGPPPIPWDDGPPMQATKLVPAAPRPGITPGDMPPDIDAKLNPVQPPPSITPGAPRPNPMLVPVDPLPRVDDAPGGPIALAPAAPANRIPPQPFTPGEPQPEPEPTGVFDVAPPRIPPQDAGPGDPGPMVPDPINLLDYDRTVPPQPWGPEGPIITQHTAGPALERMEADAPHAMYQYAVQERHAFFDALVSAGNFSLGNWTVVNGTWVIDGSGNLAATGGLGELRATWNPHTYFGRVAVEGTFPQLTASADRVSLLARWDTAALDGYELFLQMPALVCICKITAGTRSIIQSVSQAITNTDVWRFTLIGGKLKGLQNGVEVISGEDTDYVAGAVGMGVGNKVPQSINHWRVIDRVET